MCALKLGSLFDGIGVFPLAASRNGIIPVWASEIEKSPIAITKRHFPGMEHLGDITKIHGGHIPPVHIITFGSPCQNLSKIGKREGLAGSKSGLFFQAIRIIEEMRCATNGLYPVIAVWENVMGAFSSNDRMDFRAVLQSFPIPKFQCLLLEDGLTPVWCEGEKLTCAGGSWTPSIGESPGLFSEEKESSLWRILEDSVPQKYYLSPAICSRFLRLAQTTGCPPPEPVEYLLIKQGGRYPSSAPFRNGVCGVLQNQETSLLSSQVSDGQMNLFQLCWQKQSI